ncbi:unnamed protein product [Didymodactylos carnosus]|uniref:Uncharacterized protein n=1 Tax=Didymodactylos carnosus TaxID=1234261 RepID=A0A815D9E2_9BILA|nr:unnamed protein product [Didymodactylos carnosus]CAF4107738.1 unnamed protein product [Didymodactylos carnosus]
MYVRHPHWSLYVCTSGRIFETFGIRPKLIPQDKQMELTALSSIMVNKDSPKSGRPIVAIGETGLDDTSKHSIGEQLMIYTEQVLMAARFQMPLVLHCRGTHLFRQMYEILKTVLPMNHPIHWHCINANSDLSLLMELMNTFPNSYIAFNGSSVSNSDENIQKAFRKWILDLKDLLSHLILETDFPFLCPEGLYVHDYNPISGIFASAKFIEETARIRGENANKLIQLSNSNIRRVYNLSRFDV